MKVAPLVQAARGRPHSADCSTTAEVPAPSHKWPASCGDGGVSSTSRSCNPTKRYATPTSTSAQDNNSGIS